MAVIRVEPEDLRALSQVYHQQAAELRESATRLGQQTAPLLDNWIGATSSAFQNVAHHVDSRQRELITAYEEMADAQIGRAHV